nr:MAG TPA: hypothetical protein [Caudoviricetes sp.]
MNSKLRVHSHVCSFSNSAISFTISKICYVVLITVLITAVLLLYIFPLSFK